MSFGVYPGVTLAQAREKRQEARMILQNNINPISEKRIKKNSEILTFNDIVEEWLKFREKNTSLATVLQNKRIFKNITKFLGTVALKDIKRIDLIEYLKKVQNNGTIETAHRLYSLLNKLYKYAVTVNIVNII